MLSGGIGWIAFLGVFFERKRNEMKFIFLSGLAERVNSLFLLRKQIAKEQMKEHRLLLFLKTSAELLLQKD